MLSEHTHASSTAGTAVDRELQRRLERVETVPELADVVRSAARDAAGADGATFVVRDGDRCFYVDEDSIAPLWKGQRFPIETCISGWAMLNDQAVSIPDITTDDRIPQAAYRPTFVRSLMMLPVGRGRPTAAIGTYWARKHHATEEEQRRTLAVAAAAAAALERIGLDSAPWAPTFS